MIGCLHNTESPLPSLAATYALLLVMICGQVQRKLVIACVLCFIFMIVEVIGGYLARR